MEGKSLWAERFILAAIIQGAVAFIIAAAMLFLTVFGASFGIVSPSRIVAAGSAGTWIFVGYVGYIMVGVLAVGLSALFYHYIEVIRGRPYAGRANALAWAHLLLMNIGAAGASILFIWAGHIGGSLFLAGTQAQNIHPQIVGFVNPIAAFMTIGALGVFLGGIGYGIQWRKGAT